MYCTSIDVKFVIKNQVMSIGTKGYKQVDYYNSPVGIVHDFPPFGREKPLTQDPYPFAYQGQLLDREIGCQYYRYRNYDPLVARFWQVEPLIDSFPWLGYVFSENQVVISVELEGLEAHVILPEPYLGGGAVPSNYLPAGQGGNVSAGWDYNAINISAQDMVTYGTQAEIGGTILQAAGVAVILITAGSGTVVGVVLIEAGMYVSAAGTAMKVTGYVIDEKYDAAVVSVISAATSKFVIGKGAKGVYTQLRKTALTDLPKELQEVVKSGAVDAPRLGLEQLTSVVENQVIEEIMNSKQQCEIPDWYLKQAAGSGRQQSKGAQGSMDDNSASQPMNGQGTAPPGNSSSTNNESQN